MSEMKIINKNVWITVLGTGFAVWKRKYLFFKTLVCWTSSGEAAIANLILGATNGRTNKLD